MATTTGPRPHKTTTHYDLMQCPVCSVTISAEISIEATFGEAAYNGPTDIALPVEAKILAFNVLHSCEGPPPPPPEDTDADGGPTA